MGFSNIRLPGSYSNNDNSDEKQNTNKESISTTDASKNSKTSVRSSVTNNSTTVPSTTNTDFDTDSESDTSSNTNTSSVFSPGLITRQSPNSKDSPVNDVVKEDNSTKNSDNENDTISDIRGVSKDSKNVFSRDSKNVFGNNETIIDGDKKVTDTTTTTSNDKKVADTTTSGDKKVTDTTTSNDTDTINSAATFNDADTSNDTNVSLQPDKNMSEDDSSIDTEAIANSIDPNRLYVSHNAGNTSDEDDSEKGNDTIFEGFERKSGDNKDLHPTSTNSEKQTDGAFNDILDDFLDDESEGTSKEKSLDDKSPVEKWTKKREQIIKDIHEETPDHVKKALVENFQQRREINQKNPKHKKDVTGLDEQPKRKERTVLEKAIGVAHNETAVVIGPDGRPKQRGSKRGKGRSGAEKLKSTIPEGKTRYTWLRRNGKINHAEMEFFKNISTSRRLLGIGDSTAVEIFAPPKFKEETQKERNEREKKIRRAIEGIDSQVRGHRTRFNEKDQTTLEFIAKFKYARSKDISRLFGESTRASTLRLKKLRSMGLVINKDIDIGKAIWLLTDAGITVSGLYLSKITDSKITYSMFQHQFTVNNAAANLWTGGIDVLGLNRNEEWPVKNRTNSKGQKVYGERLVSELEIQSSFGNFKKWDKAIVYKPEIMKKIDDDFDRWNNKGGVNYGPSPETLPGNEFMWVLFPAKAIGIAYHVPDLVVMRDRNNDGSPNSIAIEVEIRPKGIDSYLKTLNAYKMDTRIFSSVVWIVKTTQAARRLEEAAKRTGLWDEGRINIVPIINEEGLVNNKDLWTI